MNERPLGVCPLRKAKASSHPYEIQPDKSLHASPAVVCIYAAMYMQVARDASHYSSAGSRIQVMVRNRGVDFDKKRTGNRFRN
jgi:hypothetical protein